MVKMKQKKRKESYLVKGEYTRPQPSGYLALRQYMLIEQDEKHCLLLRFENEMRMPVTEAEISVTQLDSDGNEIGERIDILYTDISVDRGKKFCAERGIVVLDECADCIVKVRYVICGNIRYELHNGQVTGHYDIRGYEREAAGKKQRLGKKNVKIRSRYAGGGKFYRLVAFVSLVLAVLSLFFVKSRLENADKDDNFRNSRQSLAVYESRDSAADI